MVSVYNVVLYFAALLSIYFFLVLTVRTGALGVCTVRGEISAFLHLCDIVRVTYTYVPCYLASVTFWEFF